MEKWGKVKNPNGEVRQSENPKALQSKIHDKDAITILFILEMTSAAILTCTKRKSTLSYPYVHILGSPRPHPLEKRLSLYFTPFLG